MRRRHDAMFCTRCGNPVPEGSRFCTQCGQPAGPAGPDAPLAGAPASSPAPLTGASHLVLLRDKLAMQVGFQIQDPSGRPLGGTSGGLLGLSGPLTLFDADRRAVLELRAARVRGAQFGISIHDPAGTELATLLPKSSFMSQKWGISVGATEPLVLVIKNPGLQYQVEEAGTGKVVATADRTMAVRTSKTEVEIAESPGVDRRIVLGAMIAAANFTIRGMR